MGSHTSAHSCFVLELTPQGRRISGPDGKLGVLGGLGSLGLLWGDVEIEQDRGGLQGGVWESAEHMGMDVGSVG